VKPVIYITSFRKLVLTETISGHVELIPSINIANDAELKEQLLTAQCRLETVEKLAQSGEIWARTVLVQDFPCGFSSLP